MNIIFFGSSKFAGLSLKALLASRHNVACVLTQPDRQKGRGLHLSGTVIKTMALESGVHILQPYNVNGSDTVKFLKGLEPDLFVVIAYGQILSSAVLDVPKIFSLNVHASLLPKYRGAAPINWALIKGDNTTGITVIKMTKDMDAGAIILQKEREITEDDTAFSLEDKLSDLAAELLLMTLEGIEENNYNLILQDEDKVSFAPKLKKEDGLIHWHKSAQDIYNLIRGCINWPGAFTYYNGRLLKIYKARVSSQIRKFASSNSGGILEASKEGIVVFTGKGNIIIEELQIEGKRVMRAEEFVAGHKILPGEILGQKNSCSSSSP